MKGPEIQPHEIPQERPGPVGGKRDLNRRLRAQQVADRALELFLEKGIGAVTVAELARAAGMAKGSFYRYADSMPELVERLFEPLSLSLDDVVGRARENLSKARGAGEVAAAYQALAGELLRLVGTMPGALTLYLQESRAPALGARAPVGRLRDRIRDHAIELTTFAQEHGLLRPVRPDIAALTVVGAVELHLFELLQGRSIGDPAEGALALISVILEGVATPE